MIDIPIGILVLFMLFMLLLSGMAYEAYIRPRIHLRSPRIKRKKAHLITKARKV